MKKLFRAPMLAAAIGLLTALLTDCRHASAQQAPSPSAQQTPSLMLATPMSAPTPAVYSPFIPFWEKYNAWLEMVRRTHEDMQPNWMTPLVTVTPLLQQELRTDYSFEFAPHNLQTFTYASKGTEIIPTENTEFIFGNPSYITKNLPADKDSSGFADWPLTYKFRLLSSPSDAGNYVVTFLFAASFATGSNSVVSENHDVFSPLIGFGKGILTQYGEFDYQATLGPSVPDADPSKNGTPITWNSTFQYGNRFHLGEWTIPLWPAFETMWVAYPNGEDRGEQQLYLTPELIAGRFQMTQHTYFVLGAGFQFAVTRARNFNNQWIATMRIPFY
jgi:hypothetical protein